MAVAGAGFAGGVHAQAWAGIAGAELAVVVDLELERARAVAEKWGGRASRDLDDALGEDVDVVSVCLPTVLHDGLAVAAARAGKHVLCEKPVALDLERADRMLDAARAGGVRFMVGHVLRFWPEYERLVELVADGRLGRLRALSCSRLVTRPGPYAPWLLDPAAGLGLGEVAVHDLDLVATLLGPPRALVATGLPDGGTFSALHVLLRYDDAVATVEAGWGTPAREPFWAGYRAVFDGGIAEYDARRRPTLRVVDERGAAEWQPPPVETEGGPWRFDAVPYLREVEAFAAAIEAGVDVERCPPAAGRGALALVLAAEESARSGREVPLG